MTPKERANELHKKFLTAIVEEMMGQEDYTAKQCALIAVDEMIKEHTWASPISWNKTQLNYWNKVKTEIENL